ncbi:flocculation protein FLO11-like [Cucumis melo var. makuwa]|uniref:Flocculation protein FLO11-like n=1 Tax=Cucumis melo var. makuwa TaxID=1194695 RepID=A0A5D3CLJ5_CUCMM|nr:flocculation protein FLO11-like [Cucumis melo var. makuwa]
MPIDGVSFHSEEGAYKWKYVVKWQIADEANISDQYNSCLAILDLICNDGLHQTVSGLELTGETIRVSPVRQLPVASLTVKYAILHRIGISNWIPFTHASTILTSLGHFVYLVGSGVKMNWFSPDSTTDHFDPTDTVGTAPRLIPLSMRLFQGSHILDVAATFENAPVGTSAAAATNPTVGQPLVLSVSLANRLLQVLLAESRCLTRQISELSDRRTVLDVVLRDLRRAASGSSTPPSDQ